MSLATSSGVQNFGMLDQTAIVFEEGSVVKAVADTLVQNELHVDVLALDHAAVLDDL